MLLVYVCVCVWEGGRGNTFFLAPPAVEIVRLESQDSRGAIAKFRTLFRRLPREADGIVRAKQLPPRNSPTIELFHPANSRRVRSTLRRGRKRPPDAAAVAAAAATVN